MIVMKVLAVVGLFLVAYLWVFRMRIRNERANRRSMRTFGELMTGERCDAVPRYGEAPGMKFDRNHPDGTPKMRDTRKGE